MYPEVNVNGTLIWYYYICQREVWLMAHKIAPDQDNELINLGRFMHEYSYQREKKEIDIGHIKLDIIRHEKGRIVVGEVKKSSRYKQSAKMQLAYYLWQLKSMGVDAKGELRFPKEKSKLIIELNEETVATLRAAEQDILDIIYKPYPPKAKKCRYCSKCGYAEFCWS